jgi:5-methylcytosine-specific restriction endonuclease McrA
MAARKSTHCKCGVELTDDNRSSSTPSRCKSCQKIYMAEYDKKNAQKKRAYMKEYEQNNKQTIQEKRKIYDNQEHRKIVHRTFTDRWKQNNPEKAKQNRREGNRKHRLLRRCVPGTHSQIEFYEKCLQFYWQCAYCSTGLNKKTVTEDHVIPLSKGGNDDIDNIVPCCYSCNSSKNDRTPEEWRSTSAK